jgi:hypothetical protein
MNGLFQMDGTDVTAVLMSCLSRSLDLPLGTSFWSQNRSFHKIMPIKGFSTRSEGRCSKLGWFFKADRAGLKARVTTATYLFSCLGGAH